jgi:flagellar biosynthesis/type III secretory pathway M-ring protein FliF/YscJ
VPIEPTNYLIYIIIAVVSFLILLLILIIVIVVIIKKKKKNDNAYTLDDIYDQPMTLLNEDKDDNKENDLYENTRMDDTKDEKQGANNNKRESRLENDYQECGNGKTGDTVTYQDCGKTSGTSETVMA